jgi:hypothetical protein
MYSALVATVWRQNRKRATRRFKRGHGGRKEASPPFLDVLKVWRRLILRIEET